ncbi:tetratricopeptide repeat protein [bacterium]|nr:tetratricopeptide repeat protein [bacterium]MCG2677717.1 tetratricopeptide repeat protein [bacterium]
MRKRLMKSGLILMLMLIILASAGYSLSWEAKRHRNLGYKYYEQGEYKEAAKELEKAIEMGDTGARTTIWLQNCYREIRKTTKLITEDSLKETIAQNPDDLQAHWQLAFLYKKAGYTGMMADEFREVVRINPGITEAHYQLGVYYESIDNPEEAIKEYEKTLEIEPNYSKKGKVQGALFTLHYNQGVNYYNKREFSEARENFQKALKLKPEAKEVKELLEKTNEILGVTKPKPVVTTGKAKDLIDQGDKYYNFGQYDAAIQEFQKAVETEPRSLDAHLYLAYAYEKQGEKEKAIGEYQKITEIDPNHLDAHYQLGIYYDSVGKKEEAIKEYEKVLSLKPSKEKLEKISPVLYTFYYNQGKSYYQKKKYREAKEQFQKALKVKPGDFHATEMLSTVKMLLEEQGRE